MIYSNRPVPPMQTKLHILVVMYGGRRTAA